MLNIPNSITLLRILAVPIFLSLLVDGSYAIALAVFVVSGVSDAVDGAIARLTDTRTELGAHLDPLADKLLLVSSYIALGVLGLVPMQLMITVILRDTVILGGYIFTAVATGKPMEMAPSFWGKGTTFLQILTVTVVLVARADLTQIAQPFLWILYLLTAAACFVSGAHYVWQGIHYYNDSLAQDADADS